MPLLSNPRLGDQFCITVYLEQLQLDLTASHTGNWSHPLVDLQWDGPTTKRGHTQLTWEILRGIWLWCPGRTVLLGITENLPNKATLSRLGDVTALSDCCCSVTKLCPALCYPMNCSTPDFPVLYCLPKFAQTHVHWVSDTIQPSHPLLPSSPLTLNLSQIRVFSSEWVLGSR